MPTIRRIDHWVIWGDNGGWNIDSSMTKNEIVRIVINTINRARLTNQDWEMLGYGYATELENPVIALRMPGDVIDSVDYLDLINRLVGNVRFILENFK